MFGAEVQRGRHRRGRHRHRAQAPGQAPTVPARPGCGKSQQARAQQAQRHRQAFAQGRQRRGRLSRRIQPVHQGLGPGHIGKAVDQPVAQAVAHLAQAQRHRRGEEQRHRPEHQQRQRAAVATLQPALARRLPLPQQAQPVRRQGQQRPGAGARQVQQPVQQRRHPLRQQVLGHLHCVGQRGARQGSAGQRQHQAGAVTQPRHAHQQPQHGVSQQVADDVEGDEVTRPGQAQQVADPGPGRPAPATEGKQAGVDNQRHPGPGQRQRRASLPGGRLSHRTGGPLPPRRA